MRPMRLALLLVLTLALAGCGGDDAPETGTAEPAPDGGSISGVVVTPAIQPITGATVVLESTGAEQTTDLFGRFRFTGLDPGAYVLSASAPDHEPAKLALHVQDGETARPRIQLTPVRPPAPGKETLSFQGRIESSFGPADEAVTPAKGQVGLDGCTCTFEFAVPRDLVAITVEAFWEDTFQVPEGGPQPAFRWNLTTPGGHAAGGSGPTPLHAVATAADFTPEPVFAEQESMTLTLLADAAWPTVQQDYQVFLTLWEVEQPPEGWSFLRGDP